MRMMREAAKDKGLLGFGGGLQPAANLVNWGTGVSYVSAPAGAQTYSANALVGR